VIAWDVTLAIEHSGRIETITFQTRELEDDHHVLSFGASQLADVELTDPAIAATHCWLLVNDAGHAWIRAATATSGTRVAGQLVDDTARFSVGDALQLGAATIRMTAAPQLAAMTWKLVLDIGARGGRLERRVFHKDTVIVGRISGADIQFRDGNVSKRHCMLRVDNAGCVSVRDLGSANGMSVNGRRIRGPEPLAPGDKAYVGDQIVVLVEAPKRVPI
jgi:pSer/pThr/pTyr-binding forkhead associated (FHA) protein